MKKIKREFFHKGVDNQSRPDIIMDLRRPDKKEIAKWSEQEKANLMEFMETCEAVFKVFKNEIAHE